MRHRRVTLDAGTHSLWSVACVFAAGAPGSRDLALSAHVFFSGEGAGASVCWPVPSPAYMPVDQRQKLAEGNERTEYEEPLVRAGVFAALGAFLGRLDGHFHVHRKLEASHWDP
jgi:hypothetical protein